MGKLKLATSSVLLGLAFCISADAKIDKSQYAYSRATVVVSPVVPVVAPRHYYFRNGYWYWNGTPYIRYYRHGHYYYEPYYHRHHYHRHHHRPYHHRPYHHRPHRGGR